MRIFYQERIDAIRVGAEGFFGTAANMRITHVVRQFHPAVGGMENVVENLYFFISREEGFCRWFELTSGGKGTSARLCSAPLELAEMIAGRTGQDSGGRKVESIVGGGDTIAAIERLGIMDKFTFISTGGGAMLDFLAKGTLPGIEALGSSPA